MASRFTVTDAPTHTPGVDYVTGSGVGPFIDTGRDIRDQAGRNLGRLYLSKDSVREMAQELGLLGSPEGSVALETAYNKGKLDALKEELGGELYSVAGTLRRWLEHVAPAGDSAGDSSTKG